jgi:hypothetical protein
MMSKAKQQMKVKRTWMLMLLIIYQTKNNVIRKRKNLKS